jgi:hypothetical protein
MLPNPPDTYIDDLQRMVYKFVWNGKRDRISRCTAVKNVSHGGLGIPHIRSFIDALKLTWINKLKNTNHQWKQIVCQIYQNVEDIHLYGPSIYSTKKHSNLFWKDVFRVYEQFRYKIKPQSSAEVLSEPLFFNNNLKINNNYIYYKNWMQKSVNCIGNLIDDRGHFYTYQEFTRKYDIQVNPLTYLGCMQTVKKYLKSLNITIENNEMLTSPKSLACIHAQVKGTKSYYNKLTENEKAPNCCSKWETKLGEQIDWNSCFYKIKHIREVKLKWFQIRLLHRILATNIVFK